MTPIISQFDLVTAYGYGIDALWNGLFANQTAIRSTDRFKDRQFVSDQAALVPELQCPPGTSRVMAMLTPMLAKLAGNLNPKTPLILATTVGEIEFIESAILNGPLDYSAHAALAAPSNLLSQIKALIGLTGPATVISSACASSSAALSRAASIVQHGEAPAVLVVACDAISEFVYSGFSTLQSLCDTPAKPFDANRCGLSLGEAAAWALVTGDDPTPVHGEVVSILGWASTSDAIHMTAPDRNGGGLSRAITRACAMANADPADIAFIAAHGTATLYSDAMELLAFRAAVPKPVPIFSVKGGTGHTLGAAGLIQILVSARALSRGQLPPTVGLIEPDAAAAGWVHTSPTPLNNPSVALSTNSGFGGVNTAVVLGRIEARSPKRPTMPLRNQVVRAVGWSLGHESSEDITRLIGKPIKYLSRMTSEARCCLVAAAKALKAANLDSAGEIGLLAAGEQCFLDADLDYFDDYLASGRSMGRGNLFIYTLPTSAASEVAIALHLTGPALFMQNDSAQVQGLIESAGQLLTDNEAQAVLALWSGPGVAVCFAIALDGNPIDLVAFDWTLDPLAMASALATAEQRP
jgi:3-oxoacyl-[acyl-carrier-protein] synthase II